MTFNRLVALEEMVKTVGVTEVLCDLAVVCKGMAQMYWDKGERDEFSRWDQHQITLEVSCEFMRKTDKERDSRK